MKESKGLMLGLLAIVMIALAIGFTAVPSAMAEQKEPVVIGALFPQTGPLATEGSNEVRGITLAVEEINELGGVLGRPFKVIFEDDESRPKAGMDAIHKLVEVNRVPLVLGAHSSSVTMPTATYTNTRRVVQISTSSTSPDIRHLGPYHFSIVGLDDLMGKYSAQFAIKDSGKKKWGIMVMNDPYGVGLAREMDKELKKLGGEVVSLVKYEMGKTDYRAELQRLFDSNPEGILSVAWGEIAKIQFKQAFELGLWDRVKGSWYCPYPLDVVNNTIPETVEGLKGVDLYYGSPRTADFVEGFNNRYPGVKVSSYAARAYDACWVAGLAIDLAGSTEPDRILRSLPTAFNIYKGASSMRLEVDEDGMQVTQIYAAYITRNGELVLYQEELIGM